MEASERGTSKEGEMAAQGLIYYVEDDQHIRDLAAYALQQAGHTVRTFPDGTGFAALCAAEPPDAVLLDIMLPGDDGLELLRQLRGNPATAALPVMMLTAKGAEYDTVCGLDAGADDYLAKPFGMMELLSRVNALLRRSSLPSSGAAAGSGEAAPANHSEPSRREEQPLHSGGISLYLAAHRAVAGGRPVPLTVKEFALLEALMKNEGRVLTRNQLLQDVWDIHFAGETRTVDAHVKTLRQKLAEAAPGTEALISTVRGVGYRFEGGDR